MQAKNKLKLLFLTAIMLYSCGNKVKQNNIERHYQSDISNIKSN